METKRINKTKMLPKTNQNRNDKETKLRMKR